MQEPQRNNVVQFVPGARARVSSPATVDIGYRSPAAIMAEAFRQKLGDTDLANYAVQSAVDGVLQELARLWRGETEARVRAQLAAENAALRAEIARGENVDHTEEPDGRVAR